MIQHNISVLRLFSIVLFAVAIAACGSQESTEGAQAPEQESSQQESQAGPESDTTTPQTPEDQNQKQPPEAEQPSKNTAPAAACKLLDETKRSSTAQYIHGIALAHRGQAGLLVYQEGKTHIVAVPLDANGNPGEKAAEHDLRSESVLDTLNPLAKGDRFVLTRRSTTHLHVVLLDPQGKVLGEHDRSVQSSTSIDEAIIENVYHQSRGAAGGHTGSLIYSFAVDETNKITAKQRELQAFRSETWLGTVDNEWVAFSNGELGLGEKARYGIILERQNNKKAQLVGSGFRELNHVAKLGDDLAIVYTNCPSDTCRSEFAQITPEGKLRNAKVLKAQGAIPAPFTDILEGVIKSAEGSWVFERKNVAQVTLGEPIQLGKAVKMPDGFNPLATTTELNNDFIAAWVSGKQKSWTIHTAVIKCSGE